MAATVRLLVTRELLESWLCLGNAKILGVSMEPDGIRGSTSINDLAVFVIYAPDAPDGATSMDPMYTKADDGTVTMTDPRWR